MDDTREIIFQCEDHCRNLQTPAMLLLQADYNLSLVEYELVSIAGIGAGAPPAPNAAVTAGA